MTSVTELGDQWERELLDDLHQKQRKYARSAESCKAGGEYQAQILRIVAMYDRMISALSQRAPISDAEKSEFIREVVVAVAEIPDRNSPKDQPEMMLVAGHELANIIESVFQSTGERYLLSAQGAPAMPCAKMSDAEILRVAKEIIKIGLSHNFEFRKLGVSPNFEYWTYDENMALVEAIRGILSEQGDAGTATSEVITENPVLVFNQDEFDTMVEKGTKAWAAQGDGIDHAPDTRKMIDTIRTLTKYNEWRRGGGDLPDHKSIGDAIDYAIAAMSKIEAPVQADHSE